MIRFIKLIIFFLFFSSSVQAQEMIDFSFTDVNGNSHNLFNSLDNGNVVVLDFFYVSCVPCVGATIELEQIRQDYDGKNVEIWSISPYDMDSYIVDYYAMHDFNLISGGVDGGGDTIVQMFVDTFNLELFPTISVICPDRSYTWDIWPYTPEGAPEWRGAIEYCGVYDVSVTGTEDLNNLDKIRISPNPAEDNTILKYFLNENSRVEIDILDYSGKLMKNVYSGHASSGEKQQFISTDNLTAGIYFIKISIEDEGFKLEKLVVK